MHWISDILGGGLSETNPIPVSKIPDATLVKDQRGRTGITFNLDWSLNNFQGLTWSFGCKHLPKRTDHAGKNPQTANNI